MRPLPEKRSALKEHPLFEPLQQRAYTTAATPRMYDMANTLPVFYMPAATLGVAACIPFNFAHFSYFS